MKTKLLLFIAVLFFFSCGKETLPFKPKSTAEMTDHMKGEIKELSQLRLSFGKAVANALEDVEFREYIQRISREGTDSFFNEIVFSFFIA